MFQAKKQWERERARGQMVSERRWRQTKPNNACVSLSFITEQSFCQTRSDEIQIIFFFISFRAKICISTIYFGVHLRYGLCCPAQMRFYFWTVWMVNGIDVDWDGKSINLLWNKHGLVVLDQRVRVKEIRSKWFDASQFRFQCETNQNTLEKIINFGGVTYICTPCSTAHRYYLAYQLILIRGSNPSPS